jgi:uncharacterized protein
MNIPPIADYPVIEIRGFKWQRRRASVALAYLIGEDSCGKWTGIAKGNPWLHLDGSRSGIFEMSFIKLFPVNTYWTACFGFGNHDIDVDISLPVQWVDNAVEEVDLELDILRTADGLVYGRDEEAFNEIRDSMPPDIVAQAEKTFAQIHRQIEQKIEPFGEAGFAWLRRFLSAVDAAQSG